MGRIGGKVAIVTGSTYGIGEAIARVPKLSQSIIRYVVSSAPTPRQKSPSTSGFQS